MGDYQSWVPEFYYDLIARITPGALTLVVIGHAMDPASQDRVLALGSALLLPLGVLLAYVVGFLLQTITSWFFRILLVPVRALTAKSGAADLWRVDPWVVALESAPALGASWLVKAIAERSMVLSLTTLAIVAVAVDAPILREIGAVGRIGGIVLLALIGFRLEMFARRSAVSLRARADSSEQ